jgi:H+/Cl- antiporter ClcA
VLSSTHINSSARQLLALLALTLLLYALGVVGMAYVAGFGAVHRRLDAAHWWWLGPAFGGLALAYFGYFFPPIVGSSSPKGESRSRRRR